MRKLLLFLSLFISMTAFSQLTTSEISGIVKSKNGKRIEHVKVQLILKSKGITYGTFTDEKGRFIFRLLEVGGPYVFKADKVGYRPYEKRNLEFELGDNNLDAIIENEEEYVKQ